MSLTKCKNCGKELPELNTFREDCPDCGATGGDIGTWWTYI